VSLDNYFGATLASASATAYFFSGAGQGCTGPSAGPCCLRATGAADGGTSTPIGAGTISVTDTGVSIDNLLFDPTNGYPSDTVNGWFPGDVLTVSAAGGTVKPFGGTVTAPAALANLSPPYDSVTTGPVPLGQDLVLHWTPAGADRVSVLFPAAAGVGVVICTVPDSAGTMTIPASMLDYGDTTALSEFDFERQTVATVSAPNATVSLETSYYLVGTALFGGCGASGWPCQGASTCCSLSCTSGACAP
jgi:hypothetical protein